MGIAVDTRIGTSTSRTNSTKRSKPGIKYLVQISTTFSITGIKYLWKAGMSVSFMKREVFAIASAKNGPILSARSASAGPMLLSAKSARLEKIGRRKDPTCSTSSPPAIFTRVSLPENVSAATAAAPPKVAESCCTTPSKSLVLIRFSSNGMPSFCKPATFPP